MNQIETNNFFKEMKKDDYNKDEGGREASRVYYAECDECERRGFKHTIESRWNRIVCSYCGSTFIIILGDLCRLPDTSHFEKWNVEFVKENPERYFLNRWGKAQRKGGRPKNE